MAVAFLIVYSEMVKEDDGILNRQNLLITRVYSLCYIVTLFCYCCVTLYEVTS